MPVIDARRLGDRTLSAEESLLRSFQSTDTALQRYRLDDHEELKQHDKRAGRRMTHTELIRKVCKCNRRIWAEDSRNDSKSVGLYTTTSDGSKRYLVAFEKGWLPEFSSIIVDRADLPIKEMRGWRTVLQRLLKQEALSWRQVLEIFGDAHGVNSTRWRMATQSYR